MAAVEFGWGERTYVMAIVNATPDSFSGDGVAANLDEAVALAKLAETAGAAIIDVGGESTRPGHEPVDAGAEIDRVIPIIAAIYEAVESRFRSTQARHGLRKRHLPRVRASSMT